jgi:hypothetical protein
MKYLRKSIIFILPLFLTSLVACVEDETPTKERMEGMWEVTSAYDSQGLDIMDDISYPVVGFYLNSDNTVISTAGPLVMYIVYGPTNYVTMASKMDQVFNYASLNFNGGEFFVGDGVVDRFTLEMKLEGLPGQKTITELLSLLNIQSQWLNTIIYHKFMDVSVEFNGDNQMTWSWDSKTFAAYNYKDQYGNYVLWNGWPVNNFERCQITLTKRSSDMKELVQAHSK